MQPSPDKTQRERKKQDYLGMPRSPLLNHYHTEVKKSAGKPLLYKCTDFLTKRLWSWMYYYIDSRFGKKHPYTTYADGQTGIYRLTSSPSNQNDPISIAIIADWATYTEASVRLAHKIKRQSPDYTIHLGDTYYVGAPFEMADNFLNPDAPWIRGNTGSFALLGNHEMYARGIAFFDRLLPTLGIRDRSGKYSGQQAPFFCLENDHWRILGLDTGYHSIGRVPVLELIRYFAPDCHFDEIMIRWLKERVKLDDPADKRGLLILTHHQYYTAFKGEDEYPVPAEQLAALIGLDRPVLWIWGHEHKLAVYEKMQIGKGVTAYGRCIGHGGMPVEIGSIRASSSATGYPGLIAVDTRQQPGEDNPPLGYNGYVMLKIKEDMLHIAYHDPNQILFTEIWKAHPDGKISGQVETGPDCPLQPSRPWEEAVK
jgi:hypothetical protein